MAIRKLKALLQWLVLLEIEHHRHWCENLQCYHSAVCWDCDGIFCANRERKNCANCEAGKPKTCNGKIGQYAHCTCGLGCDRT